MEVSFGVQQVPRTSVTVTWYRVEVSFAVQEVPRTSVTVTWYRVEVSFVVQQVPLLLSHGIADYYFVVFSPRMSV